MRAYAVVVLLAVMSVGSLGQGATDEEEARRLAREYTEAYREYSKTGISTSLEDALTDIAFLDALNPTEYVSMGEMPRLNGRGYLLTAPGLYQLDAASFCLHAGAYGPGGGDGYAMAPLGGMGADVMQAILHNWIDHPEIPQSSVQIMVWSIDERVNPEELSPEVRDQARLLLSDAEWQSWVEFSRGEEPEMPGTIDQADIDAYSAEMQEAYDEEATAALGQRMGELAQELLDSMNDPDRMEALMAEMEQLNLQMEQRMANVTAIQERFEAKFGPLFEAQELIYEELAAQLVPEGDPIPPEGSRVIPLTRWSYDPAGLFVRYIPVSLYKRCLVQVSLPPDVSVEHDGPRITAVQHFGGPRMEITYGAGSEEAGAGLTRHDIASISYQEPGKEPVLWQGGWTLTGVPLREGEVAATAQGRATRLREFAEDIEITVGAVASRRGLAEPAVSEESLVSLCALAALCDGVADATGFQPTEDPIESWGEGGAVEQSPHMVALYQALQAIIRACVEGTTGPSDAWATLPTPLGQRAWAVPASLAASGHGGATYDPSNGAAQPGNTGRQRLGIAPKPHDGSGDKEIIRKAMEGIEIIQDLLSIANGVMDPAGWLMEKVGLGTSIPGYLFDQLISAIFETAMEISKALGGDPPRADFTSLDLLQAPVLPAIEAGVLSAERAAAGQRVLDALVAWFQNARSAQICLDRMGGAAQAGDEQWVRTQAAALVHYKRQTGVAMIELADAIEALNAVFEAEGEEEFSLESNALEAALAARRAGELSEADLEAAALLGISEEEFRAARTNESAIAATDLDGRGYLRTLRDLIEPLREAGRIWERLPEPPATTGATPTA